MKWRPRPEARCRGLLSGGGLRLHFAALLDLQRPPIRLALRGGHRDFEHAVFEGRGGLLSLQALRERDAAEEAAVGALTSVEALALLLFLLLALAGDGERPFDDLDLHILLLEAGQVGAHGEVPVALEDLDLGRPARAAELAYARPEVAAQQRHHAEAAEVLEEA